jgi:anti-sigma factor RsiW
MMENVNHISDEALERYAMRTLQDSACETLEEHLLVCQECQDRLQTMDRYVSAMRSAAAKLRREQKAAKGNGESE